MNPPPHRDERLRAVLRSSARLAERRLHGYRRTIPLSQFADGTYLGAAREALAGRSVLIRTGDMLSAAVAMIELDGLARRLILCPPDLKPEHLAAVISSAGVDAAVVEGSLAQIAQDGLLIAPLSDEVTPLASASSPELDTEWVLFTSGTAGAPKMVIHSLAGLTGAIKRPAVPDPDILWGPSMTSAATAAFRSCCARCSARARWC
jgi:non-ribosomal peptide synthetase component F